MILIITCIRLAIIHYDSLVALLFTVSSGVLVFMFQTNDCTHCCILCHCGCTCVSAEAKCRRCHTQKVVLCFSVAGDDVHSFTYIVPICTILKIMYIPRPRRDHALGGGIWATPTTRQSGSRYRVATRCTSSRGYSTELQVLFSLTSQLLPCYTSQA